MPNHLCWDSDGITFRVYSNDVVVLQTPLDPASGAPSDAVVIDPSSGLPALFPVGSGGLGLPPGHIGDLLWHDGTSWVVLAASGADGYVLTQRASGSDLLPSWQPSIGSTPSSPPPVTPTAEYQCSVARFVADNLSQAYSLLAAWMVNQSQTEVSAFLTGTGSLAATFSGILVEAFGGPLVWGATAVAALLSILAGGYAAGQLLPLSPEAEEDVRAALYCAIRSQGSSQLIVDGTTLFRWSINLEASGLHFIGLQDGVLRQAIVTIPIQQFTDWSAQAAASTSTLCTGYSCAGFTYG